MRSFSVYTILFAVIISVETSFAILCSSERPPCPEGYFCMNVSCGNTSMDIGICKVPTDCLDLLHAGETRSGMYTIQMWSSKRLIDVFCDMETSGGGWTVIQNRFDGNVDFYRNFSEYENGFGATINLMNEFWLGLTYIQEMTLHYRTTMRIDLTDVNDTPYFREYQDFFLSGPLYVLNSGLASGSPLIVPSETLDYHNGIAFSTFDVSNGKTCPDSSESGWWFRTCSTINLNQPYSTPGVVTFNSKWWYKGIIHWGLNRGRAFKTSKMMIRGDI